MPLLFRCSADTEFEDLCFDFGIELDDVVRHTHCLELSRSATASSSSGVVIFLTAAPSAVSHSSSPSLCCGQTSEREMQGKQGQSVASLSDEVVYKIEVPANRYDLLCVEGLSLALRVFLGTSTPPTFTAVLPASPVTITQRPETRGVRPFIVGAVLRGVTFNDSVYRSFIELQDKLHQNVGRRRTLVAIGTHDLDTLQGPFTYEALPQSAISFRPLGEERSFAVDELFAHYREKNSHLLPYLPITEAAPLHPVIFDAKRTVLSLPPIINGEHSRITLHTRNVLVECTGVDYTKLCIVLQTVVAMFSQYCAQAYEVEAVRVVDPDGRVTVTPSLETSTFTASVDYINRGIGVRLVPKDMVILLTRMSLLATHNAADNTLHVTAPITRTDILHACDVMEDIAIAYGYNKIVKTVPATPTVGKQYLLNKHSDQLREVVAQAGWSEVLTWALLSEQDNFTSMRLAPDAARAVLVSNPKTAEFELVRTSLLPGLLRALSSNKGLVNLPIRLFEVGDIVLADDRTEVGAHNERKLAALYCGLTSGFELIHGLVDKVLQQNGLFFRDDLPRPPPSVPLYHLRPSEHAQFFPGRQADVLVGEEVVGSFGVVHPEVLAAFDIQFPCSALEMAVETFIKKTPATNTEKADVHAVHEHPHGDGSAYVH